MSACLLIADKENIFIGSDGAVCFKNDGEYIRVSNNGKKIFETSKYLFFCSGNYKYVKMFIEFIEKNNHAALEEIESFLKRLFYLKSNNSNLEYNIEILLIEKETSSIFQISEYDNFSIKKHESPINDEILILTAGYKTNMASILAENFISKKLNIFDVFLNVFKTIRCSEIGGELSIYQFKDNKTITFDKKNIDEHPMSKSLDENLFSLIADVIVGRILAGNSLLITNDDGTTTKTFTLDQNGAVLTNASFTLQNNTTKILLDPTNGIKIQKNTGTIPSPVWTDQFYVDSSGNAIFSGSLSAASGSFNGSITATSGFIADWKIAEIPFPSIGLFKGLFGVETGDPLEPYRDYFIIDEYGTTRLAVGDFLIMGNNTSTTLQLSKQSANISLEGDFISMVGFTPSSTLYLQSYTINIGTNPGVVDTNLIDIKTNSLRINGNYGLTGTYSGMVFINGILVG